MIHCIVTLHTPHAGVAWFRAVCEALADADPGPAYRALLLDLVPDLLKGPFNDAARQDVGLPNDWYDTRLWPEAQRAEAERRSAAGGGGGGGGPAAALPPALDLPALLRLRHRLQGMRAAEAAGEALAEACL